MMNSIVRSVLTRTVPVILRRQEECLKRISVMPAYSRAVWHMSSRIPDNSESNPFSNLCSCGCRNFVHTNGERELVTFLKEEIAAEKKSLKMKTLPKELSGFAITTNNAEMTLTKTNDGETVRISLNVNHSVDTDVSDDIDTKSDNVDIGELKSRPSFEIDIVRGNKTLTFKCSFTDGTAQEGGDGYDDAYCIDEVSYFEGEWTEETYAVAGDVLDGNLYDLFMTILEEKGISNEFADKLTEVATAHEQSSYISMLEKLHEFSK